MILVRRGIHSMRSWHFFPATVLTNTKKKSTCRWELNISFMLDILGYATKKKAPRAWSYKAFLCMSRVQLHMANCKSQHLIRTQHTCLGIVQDLKKPIEWLTVKNSRSKVMRSSIVYFSYKLLLHNFFEAPILTCECNAKPITNARVSRKTIKAMGSNTQTWVMNDD